MTSATHHPQAGAGGCPFHRATTPTGGPVSRRAAAFDPFDAPYQLDPAEALRWSREQEPVFYSPRLGYWVVSRYADIKTIFRDNLTFSPSIALEKITPASREAQAVLVRYDYGMNRTLVNEDEPAHMARRRELLEAFTPEAAPFWVAPTLTQFFATAKATNSNPSVPAQVSTLRVFAVCASIS